LRIIQQGYYYDPAHRSTVAFFPGYPLICRTVCVFTGVAPAASAVGFANVCLLGAFVLFARYGRMKWAGASDGQRALVIASFGLWPTAFFFRMAYAESLFVCVLLVVLYGMDRRWPVLVLALLTGFATSVRPVGVAITAGFAWHVFSTRGVVSVSRVTGAIAATVVAGWGILAYMAYQAIAFGNPFAFAQTQRHWTIMLPPANWGGKLWSLVTFEPAWGVYIPGYSRHWAKVDGHGIAAFSTMFCIPILFISAVVLVAYPSLLHL